MKNNRNYKTLPNKSGCYLFRDKEGIVLYIGKANDLKKRVASYFTKRDHDPKTLLLINHINSIDFFITENEVEALLLENNLIRKYYPKYNINLKDSRRYAYLHLSKGDFPYIKVARVREKSGQYFGPFVFGRYRREILKILQRNFKILTQKPSALKIKSLNKKEYKERLKKAVKILKGDVDGLIFSLGKEMEKASRKTYYEHALTLKNQIDALSYLKEKQYMELKRNYNADIINFVKQKNRIYLLIFNIYKGVLENKQEFEFSYHKSFFEEFLLQYYSRNPIPKELIIPLKINRALVQFLLKKRKSKIEVIIPKRGAKKALLGLALKNVKISLYGENQRIYELKKALNLKNSSNIIECFDISHLRGKYTVASMVTFKDGKPNKGSYRKFRIKTQTGGDDIKAMKEVIYRRYAKSLKDTLPMPDLIVIDGGVAQLNSALSVLRELNLDIPIIALAKKLEKIYIPNKRVPLSLPAKNQGLLLLRAIRDEAHRFAISYNRLLRRKFIKK